MTDDSSSVADEETIAERRAFLEAVYEATLDAPLRMVVVAEVARRVGIDQATATRHTEALHRACLLFRVRKSPAFEDLQVIITHRGVALVAGTGDSIPDPGLFP